MRIKAADGFEITALKQFLFLCLFGFTICFLRPLRVSLTLSLSLSFSPHPSFSFTRLKLIMSAMLKIIASAHVQFMEKLMNFFCHHTRKKTNVKCCCVTCH